MPHQALGVSGKLVDHPSIVGNQVSSVEAEVALLPSRILRAPVGQSANYFALATG